jgi:DNA-directed RNA polymerase subunit RPC12/RpoP
MENIFRGKIYCSRCGRAVVRHTHVSSQDKLKIDPKYGCKYCLPELKRESCITRKSMELPLADLETVVFIEITRQIGFCLDVDALLKKTANSTHIVNKRRELSTKRDKLLKESGKITDLLTAAYTHHVNGLLDENEFEAARSKFEKDRQAAQVKLAQIEKEISRLDTDKARESDCLVQFRKYRGFSELNRDIIEALIKRIELMPMTNDLSIVFNYKDSFESLVGLLAESGVQKNVC